MRKAPALLAIGFILITFFRVSMFLSVGMQLGWLGVSFAIALTCGVYTAAYFTQFRETKLAAFISLVPFAIADLWFNEMEMVRSLAPETLIGNGANFLGFTSQSITTGLHVSAVVYGMLPTIFAALLGWLQADVAKVANLNKRGWLAASCVAIWATLTRGIKATLEDRFEIGKYAALPSGNSGKPLISADDTVIDADAVAARVRWEDLLAADKTAIAGMNTNQIVAKWHVAERTARNWKTRVEQGQ